MMLLVAKGIGTLVRYSPRNLGRLIGPRHFYRLEATPRAGFLWAADNDAYSGFDTGRYVQMLDACEQVPGCLFVTAPDVVGDAEATARRYEEWVRPILARGLPLGYVLQDGATTDLDWPHISAVFVGGTTRWKMGEEAAELVAEARRRGKWVHMGRVNTWQRIEHANAIGCDSIDGTSLSMFTDTYLDRFSEMANSPRQGRLDANPG
jgi:hypothetical protein